MLQPAMTLLAVAVLSSSGALVSLRADVDEGGTNLWLPGQYDSLEASPAAPGWPLSLFYYHGSVDADLGLSWKL